MAWISIWLIAAAFFLLLMALGVCWVFLVGGRKAGSFVCAPMLGLAFVGAATLLSSVIEWSAWSLLLEAAAFSLLLLFVRLVAIRMRGQEAVLADIGSGLESSPPPRPGIAIGFKQQTHSLRKDYCALDKSTVVCCIAGIAVSGALLLWMLHTWVADPSAVIRNYDNPFHFSVIRHFLETGAASPIGAGSVMGSETSIYPSFWHALVALCIQTLGIDMQSGAWAVLLLALAFYSPYGMAILASVLFPGMHKSGYFFVAAVSSVAPMSILYYLVFGSLFANVLGLSLVPLAVGLLAKAWESEGGRNLMSFVVCMLLCILVLGLSHPSTVFFLALFVFAYILCGDLRVSRKVLLTFAFVAIWLFLAKTPLFYRTVNCTDRILPSEQLGSQYLSLLGFDYSSIAASSWLILILVGAMVLLVFVVALCFKPQWKASWYLLGLGFVGAVLVCSFFAGTSIGQYVSGFWYRDVPRLRTSLIYLATVFVALLPQVVLFLGKNASPKRQKLLAGALGCALAAASLVSYISIETYFGRSLQSMTSSSEAEEGSGVLSAGQEEFLTKVADYVGDAVVLNGNQDGSVWLYPLYGCNALQKGCWANRIGTMDEDLKTVVCSIGLYGDDSAEGARVREAVDNLNIEYVVQMPAATIASDIGASGAVECWLVGEEGRVGASTPGFELVLSQGEMALYKITGLDD